MLDKAKNLLRPSARSDVPPFMVMDVMAAAARLEAQGRRIIHMEVGQPAAGAPATAIAAARAALASAPLGYTETLGHWRRCAGASRGPTPNGTASISIRAASSSPPALRPVSCWRFSPPSSRAIASRWRCRAIRLIATSSRRSAASRSGSKPARQRVGRSPAKPCWRSTAARRSRASSSPRRPIRAAR